MYGEVQLAPVHIDVQLLSIATIILHQSRMVVTIHELLLTYYQPVLAVYIRAHCWHGTRCGFGHTLNDMFLPL